MARRTHSSIDRLPPALRDTLTRMVVEGEWPADFSDAPLSKPTYEDMVIYCRQHGHKISRSAMGRWGKKLNLMALMTHKKDTVLTIMGGMTDEDAPKSQKAVAELLTAIAVDVATGEDKLSPRQIKDLAAVVRDCGNVAIKADQYIRERVQQKAKAADKQVTALAKKKKIDPGTLKAIREQIYGIVD